MLRIVVLLFFFSMACMGQTFQYSRGWTNGKRNSGVSQNAGGAAAAALSNYLRKDDDGLPDMFDMHEGSERRLERCLLQLQHLIRNPSMLHTTAYTFGMNPPPLASSPNANANYNNNNKSNSNGNSNSNISNNPFIRTHQSNELFEELTSSALDGNDYGKQH